MTLEKLNSSSFKYIKGLKEASLNEISIIKSETPLKNAGRDEIRILNFIANTINYK
jgi:hypothetical protein